MTEATLKPKPAKAATVVPMFEMPKFGSFEMPKFDVPNMEVPAAFREFAEKGVAQTKDAYEKMKATAEQGTETLAAVLFDRQQGLDRVRPEDDRDRAHQHECVFRFRRQPVRREVAVRADRADDRAFAHAVRDITGQGKELAALAQKVATDSAEPIKSGVEKALKKVA